MIPLTKYSPNFPPSALASGGSTLTTPRLSSLRRGAIDGESMTNAASPWLNISIASSWEKVVAVGLMQPDPPWPMDAMYLSAAPERGEPRGRQGAAAARQRGGWEVRAVLRQRNHGLRADRAPGGGHDVNRLLVRARQGPVPRRCLWGVAADLDRHRSGLRRSPALP